MMNDERYKQIEAERDDLLCWKEDAVRLCAQRCCATRDARLIDAEARAERAEAELAAARADAERYRWLRSAMDADISVVWGFGVVDVGLNAVVATYEEALFLDKLDAAIDAMTL